MLRRAEFLKMTALGVGVGSVLPAWAAEPEPVKPDEAKTRLNAHFVNHGPGFNNRLALTFDDGPTPGVTEIVLKELARRSIPATFFMIGRNADAYPSLAKEVAAAGHEIGNHSYTHPALSGLSEERVNYELQKTQDVLEGINGRPPAWFRPPYGAFRRDQGPIPRCKSLGVALWSVDPRDWSRPGSSTIVQRVVSAAAPGSIVLLHDLHSQTAEACGAMLDQLMEKDFQFVRLSQLLGEPYGEFYTAQS
ncbi:MAG: polysaccharide deacetylase family protein [Candidatus Methylacidiphilales bacterium]|nr:polysaccharide deacetylase family protein [Candidatus Methylacidiphilales bacterium]